MALGARTKFGAPMFEHELFRKQMYCTEESTCDIFWDFSASRSDSTPGELCPLAPLVTPLTVSIRLSSNVYFVQVLHTYILL